MDNGEVAEVIMAVENANGWRDTTKARAARTKAKHDRMATELRAAGRSVSEKPEEWFFRNTGVPHRPRVTPLELYWEVHCDPVTDDFDSDDPAILIWEDWMRRYPPSRYPEYEEKFGEHCVPIYWYVQGNGIFESAPFQDPRVRSADRPDFLTYYDWPFRHDDALLKWQGLPVVDKLWRPGQLDKGGFIQELTGWKPSALQPYVNMKTLADASSLPWWA